MSLFLLYEVFILQNIILGIIIKNIVLIIECAEIKS